MILCLDIGNTHIFGGVFLENKLQLHFRYNSNSGETSDQYGVFLKSVLRDNGIEPNTIKKIVLCSVVPSIDYSLRAACKKYFNVEPFMLQAGVKTGIKLTNRNPLETGADLIAGAIAATHTHPQKNIIIIDFGTATTIEAISSKKEYLGAAFLPGLRTSMLALQSSAAKLFPVEISKTTTAIGRSTTESIQAGLFFGHIGAIKEIIAQMTKEAFAGEKPITIGTGGFAHLFEHENIFTHLEPDLVLDGMRLVLKMNEK
ncbi:MAG: type III pantothenate kinase [Gammaproteobacteria bacterium]|nr:type III pantothenate kinase [Gammaproteobacteria bacterium]